MTSDGNRRAQVAWRTALKIAWFDVRRHWMRAALMTAVVTCAVALVAYPAIQSGLRNLEASMTERQMLGSAQFTVEHLPSKTGVAEQNNTDVVKTTTEVLDRPVSSWRFSAFDRSIHDDQSVIALKFRPHDSVLPPVTVTSGALPQAAGEVLVTPAGRAKGLPAAGPVTLLDYNRSAVKVTVVGSATYDPPVELGSKWTPETPDLVMVDPSPEPNNVAFVGGTHGPTTAERKALAAAGLQVLNDAPRGVVPFIEPPQFKTASSPTLITMMTFFLFAAVAVAMMVLLRPALAVCANDQLHTLRLLRYQGATRADLVRVLVAQGVWIASLGVLGAFAVVYSVTRFLGVQFSAHTVNHVAFFTPSPLWCGFWLGTCGAVALTARAVTAGVSDNPGVPLQVTGPVAYTRFSLYFASGVFVVGVLGSIASISQQAGAHVLVLFFATAVIATAGLLKHAVSSVGRVAQWFPAPMRLAVRDAKRNGLRIVPAAMTTFAAAVLVLFFAAAVSLGGVSLNVADNHGDVDPQRPQSASTTEPGAHSAWAHITPFAGANAEQVAAVAQKLTSVVGADRVVTYHTVANAPDPQVGSTVTRAWLTPTSCVPEKTITSAALTDGCVPVPLVSTALFDVVALPESAAQEMFSFTPDQMSKLASGAIAARTGSSVTHSLSVGTAVVTPTSHFADVSLTSTTPVTIVAPNKPTSRLLPMSAHVVTKEYATAQGWPMSAAAFAVKPPADGWTHAKLRQVTDATVGLATVTSAHLGSDPTRQVADVQEAGSPSRLTSLARDAGSGAADRLGLSGTQFQVFAGVVLVAVIAALTMLLSTTTLTRGIRVAYGVGAEPSFSRVVAACQAVAVTGVAVAAAVTVWAVCLVLPTWATTHSLTASVWWLGAAVLFGVPGIAGLAALVVAPGARMTRRPS